jgi:ParB family chromosome partitioning protein
MSDAPGFQSIDAKLIYEPATLARPVDDARVDQLADSIAHVGLLHPIIVRPVKRFVAGIDGCDCYEILGGVHRFRAIFDKLKWKEVPVLIHTGDNLHAELVTIDENLMRTELSATVRAAQTYRRKEIYESLHPETAYGTNQHTRSRTGCDSSFATATAKATGRSVRTIQQDAELGERVSDEAMALISGTHLDGINYLKQLKNLSPAEQLAKVRADLAAPKKKAKTTKPPKLVVVPKDDDGEPETFQGLFARQKQDAIRVWQSWSPELQAWFRDFLAAEDVPAFIRRTA